MKTLPLNNNVLIEVTREYEGVSRSDENEVLKSGVLIDYSLSGYHLTASAGLLIPPAHLTILEHQLNSMVGKTVRWEEFAEGGQTFVEEGKTFALIPFWRLISVTENNDETTK